MTKTCSIRLDGVLWQGNVMTMTGAQLDGRFAGMPVDVLTYGESAGRIWCDIAPVLRRLGVRHGPDGMIGTDRSCDISVVLTGNWRKRRPTDVRVEGSLSRSHWVFVGVTAVVEAPEPVRTEPPRQERPTDRVRADFSGLFSAFADGFEARWSGTPRRPRVAHADLDALGLSELPSDLKALKSAYHARARTVHPDGPTPDPEAMIAANLAYDRLSTALA